MKLFCIYVRCIFNLFFFKSFHITLTFGLSADIIQNLKVIVSIDVVYIYHTGKKLPILLLIFRKLFLKD